MKITLALFLFLLSSNLQALDLNNTEWTQVKVERKDGSKIIGHVQSDKAIIKYFFRDKTVLISVDNQYTQNLKYYVDQNILVIGEFVKFNIERMDNEVLVLTQISKTQLTDDKLNRYTFINRPYLFDYLKENNQLKIIGDSLIEYNNQFFPTYFGNIDELFMTEFQSQTENKSLVGSFIITSGGELKNIQFEPSNKFSEKEINRIQKVINSTKGGWMAPLTSQPFQYKINFILGFMYIKPMRSVKFAFARIALKQDNQKTLTMDEIVEADKCFNKGVKYSQSGKFDKASIQFVKCIEIDSLYIDAYYNLAYCYQKLDNKTLACETWNKLKEMGQKQGEYLYNEFCK